MLQEQVEESENKQEDGEEAPVSEGDVQPQGIVRGRKDKQRSRTSLTICNSCKNQAIIEKETDTR